MARQPVRNRTFASLSEKHPRTRTNRRPHRPTAPRRQQHTAAASAPTSFQHVQPEAVRSVLRGILRAMNPQIQGMRPRMSTRTSNGYNAIMNEYRIHQDDSPADAWKNHAVASQYLTSITSITNNANTLYESGWAPTRSQKRQVDNVAAKIGMEVTKSKFNLDDMLLFSNKTSSQQHANEVFGDDSSFNDIFGQPDDHALQASGMKQHASQKQQQQHNKNEQTTTTNKSVVNVSYLDDIDPQLQAEIFASLNFDANASNNTTVLNKKKQIIDTEQVLIEEFDTDNTKHGTKQRRRRQMISGWDLGDVTPEQSTYRSNVDNIDFVALLEAAELSEHAQTTQRKLRKVKKHHNDDSSSETSKHDDINTSSFDTHSKQNKSSTDHDSFSEDTHADHSHTWDSASAFAHGDVLYAHSRFKRKYRQRHTNIYENEESNSGLIGGFGALGALFAGAEMIQAASLFNCFFNPLGSGQNGQSDQVTDAAAQEDTEESDRRPAGRK